MSELRSLSLEAAIVGAVVAARLERAMPRPRLPGLPSFEAPALVQRLGVQTLGHLPSFRRRPSGLLVPAAPALILSRGAADLSGPGEGRGRGRWAEAVDLDGLAAFLRRQHPTKTAAHVSALTGESPETVRKWLRFETRPGMRATLVLVCVYGLPLVEACIRRHPAWLVEARAETGRHALAAQLAALRPQIEAALA